MLNLSFNELSGSLHPDLSSLDKLEVLDIRNNNFSGNIPEDFEDLEKLNTFLFSGNASFCASGSGVGGWFNSLNTGGVSFGTCGAGSNAPPTAINLSSNEIDENNVVNAVVGTLSTVDPNTTDTHDYSLVNGAGSADNGSFNLQGNQLRASTTFNHEAKSTYNIRVRSEDPEGEAIERTFVVGVNNVNEAPTAVNITNASIPENASANAIIGMLSTIDPDIGDSHDYDFVGGSGSADNGSFIITGSDMLILQSPNFESRTSFSVRIRSEDEAGATVEEIIVINITDVNEEPTSINLSSNSIVENNAVGALVANLTANDPDAGDTHTFDLVAGAGSADNGSFYRTGTQLFASEAFDFENKATYSIRLRARDAGGLELEQVKTISITNQNETPTAIALSNNSFAENTTVGTTIGNFTTTDPDNSDTFSYILVSGSGSADNGSFTTDGSNLELAASVDFETQQNFNIRVRSTDLAGAFTEQTFVLTATDVNEAPTALSLSSTSIGENNTVGTTVGSFSTSDPDSGDTFNYELVSGSGGSGNDSFKIIGNELQADEIFDFDAQNSYSIRVRTTDAANNQLEQTFTINITNNNAAPTAIALSNSSLNENNSVNQVIGSFSTSDTDATDTHTYSLVNGAGNADNDRFSINTDQLLADEVLDFENQSSYSIRVQSKDGAGESVQQTFSISVSDINDSPTAVSLSKLDIDEQLPANTLVGTLTTTDQDATDSHNYRFIPGLGGEDNDSFNLSGNELRTAAPFDYNARQVLNVKLEADDGNGGILTETFVIAVNDASQAPTDILLSNTTIAENEAASAVVGNLSAIDPDAGDSHTYSLVAGAGADDNNLFETSGTELITKQTFDFENDNSYSIRVQAKDSDNRIFEKIFNISVTDINEAPTALTLSQTSMAENNAVGATVGNFTTTDPDAGDTFSYELVSGSGDTDNGSFSRSGNSLTANVTFDFESKSSYSIRVRTTDASNETFDKVFVIGITNENEAPTAIALSNSSISENNTIGTVIGSFSATDPDAGETFTYSLKSGAGDADNGKFTINSGQLRANESFDFEAQSTLSIRVRVRDDAGATFEENFSVNVLDENEAPTALALSNNSIGENTANGAVVGLLSTTDPDASDTHSYAFFGGAGSIDNSSFSIDGNELRTNTNFDFETKQTYSIRLRTRDAAGEIFPQNFTITITDENDAPTAIALSSTAVDENTAVNSTIATLSTTDNVGDNHMYALVNGAGDADNGSFSIDDNRLENTILFDFETKNSYNIRLRSTDQLGESVEQAFVFTINNLNEAPASLSLSSSSIGENLPIGTTVGTFSTTDPDTGDSFTYSLVSGSGSSGNSSFSIDGVELESDAVFDFDTQNSYSIRVRVTDLAGATYEQPFTININNNNAAPTALALSNTSIAENNAVDAVVGNISTTDTDATDTHSYSLVSGTGDTGNGSFRISGNQLLATEIVDFETKSSYSIRLQTQDQAGESYQQVFTVSVTDANDAPTGISLSNSSVAENIAAPILVGTLSSTDPDATDSHSYDFATGAGDSDNDSFSISGNQLLTTQEFDFEDEDEYSIRLKSEDAAGAIFEEVIIISISDVNDAPTDLSLSTLTKVEGTVAGPVATISTTDPDATDSHNYLLVNGAGDTDNTSFSISGNQLVSNFTADYETKTSYQLRLQTTDAGGRDLFRSLYYWHYRCKRSACCHSIKQ